MTTTVKPTTLEITRTLKAPVEKVYRAWTQPEHIVKWFGCGKTGTAEAQQDLRVGGNFRVDMFCTDGEVATVTGTYQIVEPNRKLVYTWTNNSQEFPAVDTLVTVEFLAKGNETELVLKHERFEHPISSQGHSMGWGASLERFESLVQSE